MSVVSKKSLPRRTFLHGAGAALALPLLDAMIPSLSAVARTAGASTRRLGFVYIPMGSNISQWTPNAEGKLTDLSPTLESLKPFVDRVTVLTNLENKNAYS